MTQTSRTAGRPARRVVLAGAAVAALSACTAARARSATSPPTTPSLATPTPTPTPTSRTALASPTAPVSPTATAGHGAARPADWAALGRGLAGSVLTPAAAGYDAARHVYNTRFDAVRPAAVVRCQSPADVTETLAFVRRFGLPVVPRGGGHSYLGASTVAGGVVLDTGPMAAVVPDAGSGTATVGAGARLIDVYRTLADAGLALPAGSCPTVGFAGQTQGGGQGVVARAHGLTCDTVVGLDVVTADGRARHVDARSEPDLFWALRGGGGGTFGVVTGFRVTPFASSECGIWTVHWPWSAAARVVAGWQRWAASADEGDWANIHLEAVQGAPSVRISGVSLSGSGDAAVRGLTAAVGVDPRSVSASRHSWLDTVLTEAGCSRTGYAACHRSPAGGLDREGFVAGSSILGRPLPDAGVDALVGVVADRASAGHSAAVILDPLTGAVARGPRTANAFPWRGASASVQWYVSLASAGGPPLSAAVRDASAFVAAARRTMQTWAVGAYVNYPDASVTDPRTYHGTTSARLAAVRRRYDPDRLFRTPTAVPA